MGCSVRSGKLMTVGESSAFCELLTPDCVYFTLRGHQVTDEESQLFAKKATHVNQSCRDFAEFLAGIMSKYDQVLIVGDFNIHVCCPVKPVSCY